MIACTLGLGGLLLLVLLLLLLLLLIQKEELVLLLTQLLLVDHLIDHLIVPPQPLYLLHLLGYL